MRKLLNSLPALLLSKIARDHGCTAGDRKTQIEFLMEQAKSYGLNAQDFRSRYNL